MKQTSRVVAALLTFLIVTALAWAGRAAIGTSNVFLFVIVGGYAVAITIAFPSNIAEARVELTAWLRAWKDSSVPPPPPKDGAP
jgi:hypothetical protein